MAFMQVTPEAKRAYNETHWGRLQAVAMKIVSDSCCDIHQAIPHSGSSDCGETNFIDKWQRIVEGLPSDQCVFLIANFQYITSSDHVQRSKVIFVTWCPLEAPAKQKMLSAFCTQAIVSQCGSGGGIGARLQASSWDGLEYEAVREKILRTSYLK